MLSRGFKDQIYDVFRFMPQSIQVLTFSVYFYFLKKNCFLQFKVSYNKHVVNGFMNMLNSVGDPVVCHHACRSP